MFTSPIVRLIVAMYLAIWSPALCCCAIKSGLGHVTGIQMRCTQSGCCSKASIAETQQPPACPRCAPEANESDCCLAAEKGDDQASSQSRQDSGCKCHEKSIDRLPLDTGGKINLPGLSLVLQSMLMLPALGDLSAMQASAPMGYLRDQKAHPPPGRSLLAQHCSLVV